MNKSDFYQFIENQDIKISDEDILNLIEKYPYFNTAYILLLKTAAKEQNDIEELFRKYVLYFSNPKKVFYDFFINIEKKEPKLKANKKIKATKKPKKDKSIDFDPELYQRAKKHHQQVFADIIKPKVDRLSELSKLIKEKAVEKDYLRTKTDLKKQSAASQTIQQLSKDIEKPKTELKKQSLAKEAPKDQMLQNTQKSSKEIEKNKIEIKEQYTEPKKQTTTNVEQRTEILKSDKTDKKEVKSVEDIFKKIEELKKAKLQATKLYKSKLEKLEESVHQRVQREEDITQTQPKTDEKSSEKQEIEKQQKASQQNTEYPKKQKENNIPVIDLTDENKTETKTELKSQIDGTKQNASKKTAADLILEKLRNRSIEPQTSHNITEQQKQAKKVSADEILKKLRSQPTNTQDKDKISINQQEQKQLSDSKEILNKENIQKQLPDQQQTKKTAADRILEKIAQRKKQNQQEIIDNFIQKEPKIDKSKEPKLKGDLSAPSTNEPDVATERLAQIYALQGFTDKAIAVYEKLILKFPEKKDYFAQKINELKQNKS